MVISTTMDWMTCLGIWRIMSEFFFNGTTNFIENNSFSFTSYQLFSYIRSTEDISSGYSSAEHGSAALSRAASLTNATKAKPRNRRTEVRLEILYVIYGYVLVMKGFPECSPCKLSFDDIRR